MKQTFFLTWMTLSVSGHSFYAQNTRINNYNSIGWHNAFGTFKLTNKFSIHTEYQFRRNNFITEWQQSLLRLGINYQLNPKIRLTAGYGWIETSSYGEIPINSVVTEFKIPVNWETNYKDMGNKNDVMLAAGALMQKFKYAGSMTSSHFKSDSPWFNAIVAYKGVSAEGARKAKLVWNLFETGAHPYTTGKKLF